MTGRSGVDAVAAAGAAAPLLSVERLCAWYGRAQILFDVDLSVRPGEVVALMGRNGAGKSTTMKAIMGLMARGRSPAMSRPSSRTAPRSGWS